MNASLVDPFITLDTKLSYILLVEYVIMNLQGGGSIVL